MEQHPAEGTMAIHPDTLIEGKPAPVDGAPETIALAVDEPNRPNLRRFVDDDTHGLKSKGLGDLSKVTSFPNPDAEFQEYPKHVIKDGKTYSVAAEDAEPVLLVQPAEPVVEAVPVVVMDKTEEQRQANIAIVAQQAKDANVQPIPESSIHGSPLLGGAGDGTITSDGTSVPAE